MAIIKSFNGKHPHIGKRCYLAENAAIIGDCTIGDDCSIWFSAVIRADINSITLGDRTNLQDGACIHVAHGDGCCVIGNDVTIGHNATVHACTVEDGALIGMGSVVLDGAVVGRGSIVAAGAVVLHGTVIPPHEIWGGIPARRLKAAAEGQAEKFAQSYVEGKEIYLREEE
ncbi:MAG: gamma carbonic anhydrase family protein [Prevotella sp.]|jgi:carbonic anhydrase/acetyltransferase-like protein (isoleucine patch superfamily)